MNGKSGPAADLKAMSKAQGPGPTSAADDHPVPATFPPLCGACDCFHEPDVKCPHQVDGAFVIRGESHLPGRPYVQVQVWSTGSVNWRDCLRLAAAQERPSDPPGILGEAAQAARAAGWQEIKGDGSGQALPDLPERVTFCDECAARIVGDKCSGCGRNYSPASRAVDRSWAAVGNSPRPALTAEQIAGVAHDPAYLPAAEAEGVEKPPDVVRALAAALRRYRDACRCYDDGRERCGFCVQADAALVYGAAEAAGRPISRDQEHGPAEAEGRNYQSTRN